MSDPEDGQEQDHGGQGLIPAADILRAGHHLTVFDVRDDATVSLKELGAKRAVDLPALAMDVPVTFLRLPDDRVVEASSV